MAITRTTDTDDDGSGTTGTIHNNAWLQLIYDAIDADPATATLTPIITGSTSASGQAYSTQTCTYVQKGKFIVFQGQIVLTTLGTITGNVVIQLTGLPANPTGNTPINIGFWSNMTTSMIWLGGFITSGTNQITLEMRVSAGVSVAALVQADLSATTNIVFGGSIVTV